MDFEAFEDFRAEIEANGLRGSKRAMAKKYGVHRRSIDRWLNKIDDVEEGEIVDADIIEIPKLELDGKSDNPFEVTPSTNPIPQSPLKKCDDGMTIEGDVLVLPDVHVPHHDADFLYKSLLLAKRYGITQVLLAGDLLSTDQFTTKYPPSPGRKYQADVELLNDILKVMRDKFGMSVFSIMGNHDWRIFNWLRREMDSGWFYNKLLDGNLIASSQEWCTIVSGGEKYHIEHGCNFSGTNPISIAQRLASKFQCNVITGHQHLAAEGWDVSGKFRCIAAGCMLDISRLGYVNERHSITPDMTQSFVIIKKGWASQYHPNSPELEYL